ncbi:unnamed protein product, partial [Symbiodinium microadriaticum]
VPLTAMAGVGPIDGGKAIAKARAGTPPTGGAASQLQVIYLNFLTLESKPFEHPADTPRENHALGFRALKNMDDRHTAYIFSNDHPLARGAAGRLTDVIIPKLLKLGVTAHAETLCQLGTFIALRVTILHANETRLNSHRLITVFDLLHSCAGCDFEQTDVLQTLVPLISDKLPELLEEEGMLVELIVLQTKEEEMEYINKMRSHLGHPVGQARVLNQPESTARRDRHAAFNE